MPNTFLTIENIREEVDLALGSSDVEVELTPADHVRCLRESVRKYNRYRPARRRGTIAVTTSQKRYEISHPGVQGIVELEFVEKSAVAGATVDPFYDSRTGLRLNGDTFGEVDQQLQYVEQSRRIMGAEADWEQERGADGTLYVYIDTTYDVWVSYLYTFHYTPDDNADTGMQHIPDGDTDWIVDYTIAFAKGIVAKKRGKFGGVLTPDGNESTVDAQSMADESKSEIEALITTIKSRRRPLLPEIE